MRLWNAVKLLTLFCVKKSIVLRFFLPPAPECKTAARTFLSVSGQLRLTNIYRSFLPWKNNSFELGRAKKREREKQEHPFLQALAVLTDGLRADYRRLRASPSAHAENKQKMDFEGEKNTFLHFVGDLIVAQ